MTDHPSEGRRRLLLYGLGSVLVAGLVWGGFYYPKTVQPDALTLLGGARMYLGLAQVLPEFDADGNPSALRREQLAKAWAELDRAERSSPGLAITREFRAFHAWIAGDFAASADWYRQVLVARDADAAMVAKSRTNLALVELEAGHVEPASNELGRVAGDRRDANWYLAAARIAHVRGDHVARGTALESSLRLAKDDPDMRRILGDTCFAWNDAMALSCYESLSERSPLVWYRIARLKVTTGDFDNAKNALDHVRELDAGQLGRLLAQDADFWQPHRDRLGVSDGDSAAATPGK